MKMNQKQSGRTLIETLSLLALIGIGCIVGLQLYTKTMNTIRAHYLLQQVFIKVNELVQSPMAQRRKIVNISMLDERDGELAHGYEIDESKTILNSEDKTASVRIKGYFPVGLCRILKKKIKTQEYVGVKNIRADDVDLAPSYHAECPVDSDITSMTFIIDTKFEKQTF